VSLIIKFIKKILRRPKANTSTIDSQYIIERQRHNLSTSDMSPKAVSVLERLTDANFQAYLVGGGVRDLLVHKAPKDFDIATDATPAQVKRLHVLSADALNSHTFCFIEKSLK